MRFDALDSLRGVFALMVALVHLSVLGHFFHWPLVRNAGFGVDFFFVLSGFVLMHAYGSRIGSAAQALDFLWRRFGRLYPLHLATLCVMLAIELGKWAVVRTLGLSAGEAPFSGTNTWPAVVDHLLLLQGLGLETVYSWNGPSWSISTEFWACVAFVLVVLLAARQPGPACAVASALAMWAGMRLAVAGGGGLDLGIWRCLFGFFLGAATYRVYIVLGSRLRQRAAVLELAAVVPMFAFLALWPQETTPILRLLGFALAPPIAALLVLGFAFQAGVLSRTMTKAPFLLLGRVSYSIYMVHFVVGTLLNSGTRLAERLAGGDWRTTLTAHGKPIDVLDVGGPWAMDLLALVYLLTVIGLSVLSYRFIEEPGRRWFYRRPTPTPAATGGVLIRRV